MNVLRIPQWLKAYLSVPCVNANHSYSRVSRLDKKTKQKIREKKRRLKRRHNTRFGISENKRS